MACIKALKELLKSTMLKIDTSGSDMATETTLSDVKTTLTSIGSKVTKADTDNVKVVSEVAYDNSNDWKKVSVENDSVGLAKDSTLQLTNTTLSQINDKIVYVNTNKTQNIWDYAVENGLAFEVGFIMSVPSSGSKQVVFANPQGSGKTLKIRLMEVRSEGYGNVIRYVGTYGDEISITSNGTTAEPVNKRPDSSNTSVAIIDYGGTYGNTTTKKVEGVITGGTGRFADGGSSVVGLAGYLPEGYAYLFDISNDGNSDVDFSLRIEWWEE